LPSGDSSSRGEIINAGACYACLSLMLTQVGKYQIVEKIGVGGFGSVYKGRDPFIKRNVAIKTCQSDEDEIKKRFFREAEFAGNLQHRNITTIYDFGVTDEGVPYIVQEFLTGEDLDKQIKRKDQAPLAHKVRILIDITDGLGFAHQNGIVHRDIKPSNIRILEDGTVKIMDFGIAKSMVSQSTLTQTGITLGTASYLAPEQIRGEPVDARTDIFSLGVLAYEFLTFQKPFTGDHISTVLYKILNENPPPPQEMDPNVPPALSALVMRALEKNMTKRQASCYELRDELKQIMDQLAPAPPPSGTSLPVSAGEYDATVATPTGGFSRSTSSTSVPAPTQSRAIASTEMRPATSSIRAGGVQGNTSSLAQMRIRQEDSLVSDIRSTEPDKPADDGGALKVFLAALLLVLAVGGGAFYFLVLRKDRPAGEPVPTVPPPSTAEARPTVPAPAATVPAPATGAQTPPAPTAVPVPTAVPETRPTAAPATAAAETGIAIFSSNYYAELTLDGARKKGGTQPEMRVSGLKPGRHRAFFDAEGVPRVVQEFEVKPKETVHVKAEFPPRGKLEVQINYEARDAELFLDGNAIGRAPVKKLFRAGKHRLQAILPGFETYEVDVEIPEQDVAAIRLVLKRSDGGAAPPARVQ